jgi:hypothetical protein
MENEELQLRILLWHHHGDCIGKYGDDGELQCNNGNHPMIDFRRDSVGDIEYKLMNPIGRAIVDMARKQQKYIFEKGIDKLG